MDEATSRAEARKRQSPKNRRLLLGIGGAVLAVAILAAVIVAVSGGGGDETGAGKPTTTVPSAKTNVSVPLGNVSAESTGTPAQLPPEQAQAILKVVGDYVDGAIVTPLRSAKRAGNLSMLFDAGAIARVMGVDRAVMLDEGLPKVTGNLDVVAQPVEIVALADRDGKIILASAKLDVDATGVTKVAGGPLHILRRGDFVLTQDASGAWKITSYNFAVARTGAGLDPTTTTAATPTTTKGAK